MSGAVNNSKAICVLGAHRSGTSTITGAINFLGAYLGEDKVLMPPTAANPKGYWERLDVRDLQDRLLAQLKRTWQSTTPLPDQWHLSAAVRPYRQELKRLIADNFAHHTLWAWKDPRTCLLLPLWRSVLEELRIALSCVFVVRNPVAVAVSLSKRDGIPLQKGFGIWFNHYIVALKDAAGLPSVLLGYDAFVESWETELRRCASALDLDWPADEQQLRQVMSAFVRPELRHSEATPEDLQAIPHPVRELYEALLDATRHPHAPDDRFRETVNRLSSDFQAYAAFFQSDFDNLVVAQVTNDAGTDTALVTVKPPYLKRTWRRWQRSYRKRFGRSRPPEAANG
jgi:hypothetical protein